MHTTDEERVQIDIRCMQCRYILRGLRVERNCPECGFPIHDTLDQQRLAFAGRSWLSQFYNGVATLSYGSTALGLMILCQLIMVVLTVFLRAHISSPIVLMWIGRVAAVLFLLSVLAAVGLIAAGLLQTVYCRTRLIGRRTQILSASMIITGISAIVTTGMAFIDKRFAAAAFTLSILTYWSLMTLLGMSLQLLHAACKRLPDEALTRSTRRRRAILLVVGNLSFILLCVLYALTLVPGSMLEGKALGVLFLPGLISLATIITGLVPFRRARSKIRDALIDAEVIAAHAS